MLNDRKKQILIYTVEEYILTAEPVGSKRLVEKYKIKASPATVRNELAKLEEMGYLYQPYTSAGRIPTDSGYRLYVDSFIDKRLSYSEIDKQINNFFNEFNSELEDLMLKTSEFLAKITNQFSLIFAPSIQRSSLKHIDLIYLKNNRILLVLVLETGVVLKKVIDSDDKISEEDLRECEFLINKFISGFIPEQMQKLEINYSRRTRLDIRKFARKVIDEIIDILEKEEDKNLYIGQSSDVFIHPEYEDFNKVQNLLHSLEDSRKLLHSLKKAFNTNKVYIKIGSENSPNLLKDYSLIGKGFWINDENYGSLGIVGPTRMNYYKAIETIEKFANRLTKAVKLFHSEGSFD